MKPKLLLLLLFLRLSLSLVSQQFVPLVVSGDVFPFTEFVQSQTVSSVSEFHNEIVFLGHFSNFGEEQANYITRWDGSTYRKLGNNNLPASNYFNLRDFKNIDDTLYVVGSHNSQNYSFLWRYDETSGDWSQLGDTIQGKGLQVMKWQNEICVATQVGGLNHLAPDNTWTTIIEWPTSTFSKSAIKNDKLYMTGTTFAADYIYFLQSGS